MLLLLGTLSGYCQDNVETPKQTNEKLFQLAQATGKRALDIPIGSGDVIHIDVFDVPELSRDIRLSETGDISLPLIPGRIHAGGLTTFELEAKLENLLVENGLVSHPQVSIFVKEQTSQPVSVIGAVARPMVYQIVRPTSLLEILTAAGGISDEAGSVILVTRGGLNASPAPPSPPSKGGGQDPQEGENPTISIRVRDLVVSGDPTFNIPIYGGDVVNVPRSGIVYIIGAVGAPGGYVLENRGDSITVLKAVAMAHGLSGYAKGNSAMILRQDRTTGAKQEIPAPIKKILARKVDDIPLLAGDVLSVPESTGKKVATRTAEVGATVAAGIAIYRIQ